MAPVVQWSGREVRALRQARRMEVREFAAHLGYSPSTVYHWEDRGADMVLRQAVQDVLDLDLSRASEDVRHRFEQTLASPGDQDPQLTSSGLGTSSAMRTRALLPALLDQHTGALAYRPPGEAVSRVRKFLGSTSRVYVLAGPAGTGKTRLACHLAGELTADVDTQLHTASSWDLAQLDLAVEILRYGSMSRQHDALLTLESQAAQLRRGCLVVIDGISSQAQFDRIGRQLDTILRQVTADRLRFMLVVRTPPAIETAAHPVLNAATFDPPPSPDSTPGQHLEPWDLAAAHQVWNMSRPEDLPPFDQLPTSVQQLARIPLYMQLVLTAGTDAGSGDTSVYHLIDQCVRAILRAEGHDVDEAITQLCDLAESSAGDVLPLDRTTISSTTRTAGSAGSGLYGTRLASAAVLVRTPAGRVEFAHDVLREYALATRFAASLRPSGRSVPMIGALNTLAARAATSATAHTVFELTIQCLDDTDRDLLTFAALSPTIATTSTLPLMLTIAGDRGGFATAEVLRACARRCDQDSALPLAQALLTTSAVNAALGDACAAWVLDLLRRFGSAIWSAVTGFIEQTFDAVTARALLALTDLGHDDADEATFFARYYFLFLGDDADSRSVLDTLLAHQNWRVRAGLAEALRDKHSPPTGTSKLVMDSLVADGDYKVRAAAALSLHRVTPTAARTYLTSLLTDESWHVRERAVHNLLTAPRPPQTLTDLARTAHDVINSEPTWTHCPAHVAPALQRLRLTHNDTNTSSATEPGINDTTIHGIDGDSAATQRALFAILRETRTGWTQLSEPAITSVLDIAHRSRHWLVQREATAISNPPSSTAPGPDDPRLHRERFRGRRDHRSIQIALDMHDLNDALAVTHAAAEADIDLLEVGDPLIKRMGLRAIEQVKEHAPGLHVVAEMMSADWGRDQVVLAAEAGADVVQLIGPATTASVAAAVDAGRRLGIPIMLDIPAAVFTQQWVAAMERSGVDGFTVTTNIDVGIGSRRSLASARAVRAWTQLPVAVSGGFSPTDRSIMRSPDWDILIIGRSVADAVDPASAIRQITEQLHDHKGHR